MILALESSQKKQMSTSHVFVVFMQKNSYKSEVCTLYIAMYSIAILSTLLSAWLMFADILYLTFVSIFWSFC